MAFCGKCGAQLEDGIKFCPTCGAEINASATASAADGNYTQEDINSTRGLAWLSYCGPLVFIPMFTRKNSPFTQFHVRQGITLFALWVVYIILSILLNLIKVRKLSSFWGIPIEIMATPWYISVPLALLGIGIGVLSVIGIITAATGKAKKLPIIGDIDVLGWFKK